MHKSLSTWRPCHSLRINGFPDNIISRCLSLSTAANSCSPSPSPVSTSLNVSLRTFSKWSSCYHSSRSLSTGFRVLQKIHAEPHQDSESGFAQKIKEKYGSRLEGWNPTQSNNGKPFLIYEGALKRQIRSVKLFSFATTVMGLSLQTVLYGKLQGSSLAAMIGVFGIVGFFTFVTPVLIHLVAKRYVTEITYDPSADAYTSVTYSFFLQRKELKFKVEDVIAPTVPGLFTTVIVNSNGKKLPLFLADVCFHDLKHFGRLMGYDKPIDFEITAQDIEAALERKQAAAKKAKGSRRDQ